ncbi:MAG TPA: cyclin-dependent kinase inhibitor 3 family protein [Anaeromyxobacteraceae bacterium]|nr:cyclin-dependent kinase inhibitor 3 family protein [Anaeromyxobacteraceae bacterium]
MKENESLAEVPVAFIPRDALALQGRLGFCPAPGRWRSDLPLEPARLVDADLASLRACGTTTLVVLLEEWEMARIGLASLLERAGRAGLEVLWYPIPDGTAPSNVESTLELVHRIVEGLTSGRTVVVHCHGGIGRSGTITASCLVAAGVDPDRALELVRRERPLAATAPGQEEFVYAFAAAWERRKGVPAVGHARSDGP